MFLPDVFFSKNYSKNILELNFSTIPQPGPKKILISSIPRITLSLSEHLLGVPAQSGLHPWQHGSSQRSGWWRSDSEAVGIGLGLPQENTGRFTGGSRGHGDEEVAGT